jgi:hypothetical protein
MTLMRWIGVVRCAEVCGENHPAFNRTRMGPTMLQRSNADLAIATPGGWWIDRAWQGVVKAHPGLHGVGMKLREVDQLGASI